MKHQLVHIPKTGGCAFHNFLWDKYPDYFELMGHEFAVKSSKNPIVIVRNPLDRVSSIYQFWANGSDMFEKRLELTFQEFLEGANEIINSIPLDEKDLVANHALMLHILPQSRWIEKEDYSKCIVVRYQKDLGKSLENLVDYLDLPPFTEKLKEANVTKDKVEMRFSIQDFKKILNIYAQDFILWQEVAQNPWKFKKVIGAASETYDKPLSDYLLL